MNQKKIHYPDIDRLFQTLNHPVRRDIIFRISSEDWTTDELAKRYKLTRPAILSHLKQIEDVNLIFKHKKQRRHYFALDPVPLGRVIEVLRQYQSIWLGRFNRKPPDLVRDSDGPVLFGIRPKSEKTD